MMIFRKSFMKFDMSIDGILIYPGIPVSFSLLFLFQKSDFIILTFCIYYAK
jgi:hypothetical protein